MVDLGSNYGQKHYCGSVATLFLHPLRWGSLVEGWLGVSSSGSTILGFLGFGPIGSQLQIRLILLRGRKGGHSSMVIAEAEADAGADGWGAEVEG